MKRYSAALGVLAATALSVTLTACTAAGGGSGSASPTSTGSTASASASAGGGSGSASGGSTGGTGSASGSGGSGATGAAGATGATGGTGGTGGGSGSSSGVAACTGSQITVSVGPNEAAMGHVAVAFEFTNSSDTSCTLYGYPGVAMLDSNNQQVAQAKRTLRGYMGGAASGSTQPATVTVQPHAHVAARFEWSDVPQGGLSKCPTYAGMLVTPPGTRTSTRFTNFQPVACTLEIHPVVPQANGYQP